ncbi:flavin monoamine oxidase family protein [Pseudomonas paraeruginosa]|uniref:flavin monoamine oxidase family protein n=1 Tax=Pseudomonas paraeruginosa TaxID=2994495 RepID=UPI0039FCB023
MSSIPNRSKRSPLRFGKDLTALIPDFPFHYQRYLRNAGSAPLCEVPEEAHGKKVLVIGGGVAGLVAAYEVMRMGLQPILLEASQRIGGRFCAQPRGNASAPGGQTLCELGGMRFPLSGKALFHYFDKVGMALNSAPFPNPGTEAAVSTLVDYQGRQQYYEVRPAGQPNPFPKPPEYDQLEDQFFDTFLEAFQFTEMEAAMTEPVTEAKQQRIKALWKDIVAPAQGRSWDDVSFYLALVEKSGWSREQIDLFGQIGFGTGGWNTDYPNSILEVLRVLYTGLDVDHRLMYDGSSALPERLLNTPPADFGDQCRHWGPRESVLSLTRRCVDSPLGKEVLRIARGTHGGFVATLRDSASGAESQLEADLVIHTPHVRLLDKLRYSGTPAQIAAADALLGSELWEAVMYTHYMQSTKLFAATRSAFWTERGSDDRRIFSLTLSDRLTRGTYLVDYAGSSGCYKGAGIFLSYTWNDDSLKFLGRCPDLLTGDSPPASPLPEDIGLCTHLLEKLYPNAELRSHYTDVQPFAQVNWENQGHYLGAFKMNLPGQYELQRRIFSQFMQGVAEGAPYRFILAGDDVSWTGGWAEGAVGTALNAVNKVAVCLGGGSRPDNPGPVESWESLQPVPR